VASPRPESVGLPVLPFLYTLDQVATLCAVDVKQLKISYIFYEKRSTGRYYSGLLRANNIAPEGEKAEWRVSQQELIRWMRMKGFRYAG
jgi:hypothetical protein